MMMVPQIDTRSGRASNVRAEIQPETADQPLLSRRNDRPQFANWDDALASGSIAVSHRDTDIPPRLRPTAARHLAPRTGRGRRMLYHTNQAAQTGQKPQGLRDQQGGTL